MWRGVANEQCSPIIHYLLLAPRPSLSLFLNSHSHLLFFSCQLRQNCLLNSQPQPQSLPSNYSQFSPSKAQPQSLLYFSKNAFLILLQPGPASPLFLRSIIHLLKFSQTIFADTQTCLLLEERKNIDLNKSFSILEYLIVLEHSIQMLQRIFSSPRICMEQLIWGSCAASLSMLKPWVKALQGLGWNNKKTFC